MCRRLKGERGAAAKGTGKVSFFPPTAPLEGKGLTGCGRKEKPCFCLPALATLQSFLAPPILRALSSPLDSLHRSWVSVFQV